MNPLDLKSVYSHLADMDEIEEDFEAQEKFLKLFLDKITAS